MASLTCACFVPSEAFQLIRQLEDFYPPDVRQNIMRNRNESDLKSEEESCIFMNGL